MKNKFREGNQRFFVNVLTDNDFSLIGFPFKIDAQRTNKI